ncbi:5-oxoprolinase subunit PxpA [Nodularia spumigena]|uniref:5-oxoprolinase subunit PxpA n=1 Tax=Nodularia spumigena TaxID=70799 RepID=UPI002B1F213C|nr:5-oxoprolinase subunit PxpA [Nodularia spumigena]MEA5615111.1 5-oxoprolinase subunit PxpA [Nodularia spumigena UHCC 0040]
MTTEAGSTIDLNADLGEAVDPAGRGVEDALIGLVSSVNVACGGHAGDDDTMRRVLDLAAGLGCAVGAHPSYPDRAGFGRVRVVMSASDLTDSLAEQIGRLERLAGAAGVVVTHVKPHGALYHDCGDSEAVARTVLDAANRVLERPVLVGAAGSAVLAWWSRWGGATLGEGFVDRRYGADGRLRLRSEAGALIGLPEEAGRQAVEIALRGRAAADGSWVGVPARTLCLHADSPGAVEIVRRVRADLEAAGVRVCH